MSVLKVPLVKSAQSHTTHCLNHCPVLPEEVNGAVEIQVGAPLNWLGC